MKVWNMYCSQCEKKTPHLEDMVVDMESSSVYSCMYCGNWRRGNNPGGDISPAVIGPENKGGNNVI